MTFHHASLANGLHLIAESIPDALSTAVGFFVRAGSRDEDEPLSGVSHFLEHMAFKGNERRTADDVNREFDAIGAKYNAYTTEEHTVYHAAVLPEYLPHAIDLLGDLLRPTLRPDDFELERSVILEEIGQYADSPMWNAYERAMRLHFGTHPLGNSVLGTVGSIRGLSRDAMSRYHWSRYSPSNIFVAAAGNLDWDSLVDLVRAKCEGWEGEPTQRVLRAPDRKTTSELIRKDQFVQQWILLLSAGPPSNSRMRFAAEVLANVIGDDSGSRYFWALVDPGKVDTIDLGYHEFEGAGMFMTTASCDPELAEENLDRIRQILDEIARVGIRQDELEQAKNKLGTRIVLAAERPQNRLSSLGYNWSFRREYRSIENDLADLDAVTLADLEAVLAEYPLSIHTTVSLGPLSTLPNLAK